MNDLEMNLLNNSCDGIDNEYSEEETIVILKFLILLYADDTVILAEDELQLQRHLDNFLEYCKTWKLNINYSKTKVLIVWC